MLIYHCKRKQVNGEAEGSYNWRCEFCGTVNEDLAIEDEEKPRRDSLDYMLAPPSVSEDGEGLIIFCVDVSGSMCVTSEIPVHNSITIVIRLEYLTLFNYYKRPSKENGRNWASKTKRKQITR